MGLADGRRHAGCAPGHHSVPPGSTASGRRPDGGCGESMTNTIGIISMFYARPFGREHFSTFARAKKAGCEFVELLVPEPGELDLKETKAALADHGLGVVLAARVNLARNLASDEDGAHRAGVQYLQSCIEIANGLGAT